MFAEILLKAQNGDLLYFQKNVNHKPFKEQLLKSSHSKSGDTIVHIAIRFGHLDLLKFLTSQGCSLESGNFDGKRPLHEAAQSQQHTCMCYLLKCNVAIDPLKRADWTPLMLACTKDDLNIVETLVEHGASLKLKNKDGWNCFHIAVREGNLPIIMYLMKVDNSVWNTVSKNGRTPLHTAALHGHVGVVSYLLEACQYLTDSQDSCGSTPLMDAIRIGCVEVAEILIKIHHADVHKSDNLGRQCLHVAAQTGCKNSLQYLVEQCAVDPGSVCAGNQASALHIAGKEGHTDVLLFLLSQGVDPNMKDFKGRTALHIATGAQHTDCVKVLLQNGANCVPDLTGTLPQQLATKPDILQVFQTLDNT